MSSPDNKRRTELAHLLEGYGRRVQYSVFEVWLEARQEAEFRRAIEAIIQPNADSVRVYELCAACQQRVEVMGVGESPAPPGLLII